jgi:hypothetical protein
LNTAGLPDYAAPYLSFVKDTSDLYDGINKLSIGNTSLLEKNSIDM